MEARQATEEKFINEYCVGRKLESVRRDGNVFSLDFGDYVIMFNPNFQEPGIRTRVMVKKVTFADVHDVPQTVHD